MKYIVVPNEPICTRLEIQGTNHALINCQIEDLLGFEIAVAACIGNLLFSSKLNRIQSKRDATTQEQMRQYC
jgi:hypothetical protein